MSRLPIPAARGAVPADPLRPFVVPAALCLLALMLFAWRLWTPDRYMYDEVYHAYTAGQYAVGNADAYVWYTHAPRADVAYMWNHPPAGVLLIALGIRLFGDDSFGWRISSAVFGALGILIVYLMALDLSRKRQIAMLTAVFLLADGLYFVQSRVGMLDIYGVVFMTTAIWCFYRYLCAAGSLVTAPLLGTGLFLGLAVATKWNAVYPGVFLGAAAIIRAAGLALASKRFPADAEARAGVRAHLLAVPVGLVLIPSLIYLAAYIPFFMTGHSLSQWAELQNQILYYHSHLRATHAYQSKWWEWPLTLRPVWYSATYAGGRAAYVYANGNLFLYVMFVPAVLFTCARWWKSNRPATLAIAIGFFGQWLPWMLVPRIAFVYHFLPAAIFGTLAVAWATSDLMKRSGARRAMALGYIALVVANFVYFYPIRAAVLLSPQAFSERMWFGSWR